MAPLAHTPTPPLASRGPLLCHLFGKARRGDVDGDGDGLTPIIESPSSSFGRPGMRVQCSTGRIGTATHPETVSLPPRTMPTGGGVDPSLNLLTLSLSEPDAYFAQDES